MTIAYFQPVFDLEEESSQQISMENVSYLKVKWGTNKLSLFISLEVTYRKPDEINAGQIQVDHLLTTDLPT